MMPWRKLTPAQVHAYAIRLYSLVMACGLCILTEAPLHRLRDKIEGVLNTDRTVRLVVQLEAALHDSRYEVSHHPVHVKRFSASFEADLKFFYAHNDNGLLHCAGSSTSQG